MSYNDDEVIENVKDWWTRFGGVTLMTVTVLLLAFAGWRYWDSSQAEAIDAAQRLAQELGSAQQRLQAGNDKTANADLQRIGRQLITDYANTPYAVDAALVLARQAVDVNDLATAEKHLRTALDLDPADDMTVVVRSRLARVLAASKQYDKALAELDAIEGEGVAPLVQEIRGDIALLTGDRAAARTAYRAADTALAARDEARPVLALKLADVGLDPAPRKSDAAEGAR